MNQRERLHRQGLMEGRDPDTGIARYVPREPRPIRYSAHVGIHHETGKITLTIIRDVPAGISGPFGGLDEVATMGQVETYLYEHGYALSGSWVLRANYAGLNLDADLVRR